MTDQKMCRPVQRLLDARVICDPPRYVGMFYTYGTAGHVRELEAWAAELNAFIRDHRSMDGQPFSVERTYGDLCSCCGCPWEPYEEGGAQYCAGCGAIVESQDEVRRSAKGKEADRG